MNVAVGVAALLVAISAGGCLYLAARLAKLGGRVQTEFVNPSDLFVTLVLGFLLSTVAVVTLLQPPPAEEVEKLVQQISARAIIQGELLQLSLVLALLGFLSWRRLSFHAVFGWRRVSLFRAGTLALGFLLLVLPTVMAVLGLVHPEVAKEQTVVTAFRGFMQRHDYSGVLSIFITGSLCAPLAEEIFFRGYFYPVLKKSLGGVAAALLVSALFAAVHGNWQSLPGLTALALALTLAYEWTGSLLVPICMHSLFNTCSLLLLAQQTSGA